MFIRTIRGKTSDPKAVRACLDSWLEELESTARGWLGTTSGVTDEGDVLALVRFESEEAAGANSDKPEHGTWRVEMEKLLDQSRPFRIVRTSTPTPMGSPGMTSDPLPGSPILRERSSPS